MIRSVDGAHKRAARGRGASAALGYSVLAIALAGLACSGLLQRSPPSPRQIFERAVPSVVRVDVDEGSGAGFVIDAAGLIVTNLHVIDGTRSAQVRFRDGRTLPVARVRAVDERADLALIEVAASDLPVLPLADSDGIAVGERIYAIGNPLGFDYSMSDGIIGGLRELEGVPALQVSVPLSRGSSGGPILSERGEVVGVTRGIVPGGGALGIATPVNSVKALREAADGRPAQPFEEFASARAARTPRGGGRQREVPNHPVALLEGCSEQDLRRSVERVVLAIEEGAPIYNEGDPEGCYRVYARAARDLTTGLSTSCSGGRQALEEGLARADRQAEFDDKAWALRDAFDGLLDVIERRVMGGGMQPSTRALEP